MQSRAVIAVLLLLIAACTAAPEPRTASTGHSGIARLTLAELAEDASGRRGKRIAFAADVERIEETPTGIYLHLRDGEIRLPLYMRLTFGGAFREALGIGRMEFEVEVVDRVLTPLGQSAIEITPFLITQTRRFDGEEGE